MKELKFNTNIFPHPIEVCGLTEDFMVGAVVGAVLNINIKNERLLQYPVSEIMLNGLRYIPIPQWQPIETAPKDGTRILAQCGEKTQIIKNDGWGWRLADLGFNATDGFLDYDPTHWMPLPEPMQEKQ